MKTEDYIKSQQECNKWLNELTETEINHLISMHEEYARIQIEKDREMIKEVLKGDTMIMRAVRSNISELPINLD